MSIAALMREAQHDVAARRWRGEAGLHRRAITAMLAARRRPVSLVDWTSFEVMRSRGIGSAFAFDDDFAAQGFTVLP